MVRWLLLGKRREGRDQAREKEGRERWGLYIRRLTHDSLEEDNIYNRDSWDDGYLGGGVEGGVGASVDTPTNWYDYNEQCSKQLEPMSVCVVNMVVIWYGVL